MYVTFTTNNEYILLHGFYSIVLEIPVYSLCRRILQDVYHRAYIVNDVLYMSKGCVIIKFVSQRKKVRRR